MWGLSFHYRLSSKLDLGLLHPVYNVDLSSTFKATVAFNICFDWVACVKLYIVGERDCRGKGNPMSVKTTLLNEYMLLQVSPRNALQYLKGAKTDN